MNYQNKDPQVGDFFICIKTVHQGRDPNNPHIYYDKGKLYKTQNPKCITDNGGNDGHRWTKSLTLTYEYFLRITNYKLLVLILNE